MKLFVVSDIHSHLSIVREALDKAGFEINNPEHLLISCGDCFDRGLESNELLKWLMNVNNKVLVKGNHDLLFNELVERCYPKGHDKSNGTLQTVYDIGRLNNEDYYRDFETICQNAYNRTAEYRNQLVNYFETKNYIFVHSWIPTAYWVGKKTDIWGISENRKEWDPDWRHASDYCWEEAMWGNPFDLAQKGFNQTGKTIVFGHFHTSWAHARDTGCSEFGEDAVWDIYRNDKQGVIGIDKCTYYTKECNVLVLEDDLLEMKDNGENKETK